MKIENEKSMTPFRYSTLVSLALMAWMLTSSDVHAQFHKQGSKGTTKQKPAPSNVDMRNWTYGVMDARDPVVWGRSIFHPNGNYTESKLDEGQRTLQQFTYREKKVGQ